MLPSVAHASTEERTGARTTARSEEPNEGKIMILITGASGHVGGEIVRMLAEAGRPVRAMSRTPERVEWPAGVAALLDDAHAGQVYRLTGPESLTHAEQARILGEVLGRPIAYEELPAEVARQAMSAYVPPVILDSIFAHWSASVGHAAETTVDVEKALGRPARGFRTWATDHVAEF
jgi:uncharacterized protein YbjT (DUF2867 family)